MGDGGSSMECNGRWVSRIRAPNSWACARKYVGISVMGSITLKVPPVRFGCKREHLKLRAADLPNRSVLHLLWEPLAEQTWPQVAFNWGHVYIAGRTGAP